MTTTVQSYQQEYVTWLEENFTTLKDWSLLSFLKVASQFDDLEIGKTQEFMGHENLSMVLAKEDRESAIGKLVYDKLMPLFKDRRASESAVAEEAKERLCGLRDAMTQALKERNLLMLLSNS